MKNKLLYVFFSVTALLFCFSVSAFAGLDLDEEAILEMDRVESYDDCLASGDATNDGQISAADARYILRVSVNLENIETSLFTKADVDCDGKITAQDARIALRLAVGLEELPEHKLEEIVIIPATCSTEGLTVKVCTRCVKLYATITVPASTDKHITLGWETVKMPDCVSAGLAQMKCITCNEVIKEVELSATSKHSGEWIYPDGKSCIDPVVKYRTCTVCGLYEETVENPPAAHNFVWVTVKENTCTENGIDVYKCKHCGQESRSIETAAHGHLYERDVVILEPTCTENGTKADRCVYCEDTINEAGIAPVGHDYDNRHYQVTKEPSCAETGTADVICTVCGDAREIELAKTEHTMSTEWSEVSAATCTLPGCEEGVCRYCGPVEREIPATGHTVSSWVNVKPASCDEEGLRTGYCSVCGDEAAEEKIPMIPHKYDENTIYRVSGILCKEDGEGYIKCTVCGDKKYGKILCLGKCEAGETKVYSEATCTENAKTVDICRYCNEEIANSIRIDFGTKLGHDFGDWQETTPASCDENGEKTKSCSRCDEVETMSIPAYGHTTGEWEVIREASCSETGLKILVCTDCGKTVQKSESSTLPHTPTNIVIADSASVDENGHIIVKCRVECEKCNALISEEEPVTRIAIDSELEVTFSEHCDVTPGGTVYFTLEETEAEVIVFISYGKDRAEILTEEYGEYMFTMPDTVSESETITIVIQSR